MTKEVLKEILNTKSIELTSAEIQNIMDEELEKSPDEMDADLVDLCLAALKGAAENKSQSKTVKKFSVKKVLLVAAIVLILAIIAVPVGADLLDIDADSKMVRVFKEYLLIDFSESETYDISKEIVNYGIEDAVLPSMFYDGSCVITDIVSDENEHGNKLYIFEFEAQNSELNGVLQIRVHQTDWTFGLDETKVFADVERLKQLDVNGIDVFVHTNGEESVCILYNVGNMSYNITLNNCTFEEAIEIAEKF